MSNRTQNRLTAIRKSLDEHRIDTFMVLIEENRYYLSGFTGNDTRFDESAGALFITQDRLFLATDSRFETQAGIEAPFYEIYCYKEGLTKTLPDLLVRLKTKRLGFETGRLSHKNYVKMVDTLESNRLSVEWVPIEDIIENQRLIKEPEEVKTIREALAIAESVFESFADTLKPGMTEKEAAWAMEKGLREKGADRVSFPVIVASGPNSALPHAIPADRKLQPAEPILFDWGVQFNGYCSDISRTLILDRIDDRFHKVYQTIYDAQRMSIDAIGPGISSKAVDTIARDHIHKMGFKDKFGHGLGHGIGLSVHEAPRLSPLKEITLRPGMVFTVEPGIYLPGWGGVRLENMVLVTEEGAEVLNRLHMAHLIA